MCDFLTVPISQQPGLPGLGQLSLDVSLQCVRELLLRTDTVKPAGLHTDSLGCDSWSLGPRDTRFLESGSHLALSH